MLNQTIPNTIIKTLVDKTNMPYNINSIKGYEDEKPAINKI